MKTGAGVRAVAVAVVAGLVSACAPGINVARLSPARYNLGATRSVAVLQVGGDPRAASQVMVELQRSVVEGGYYDLINAVNRGITIHVGAGNGHVDVRPVVSQVQADVYLIAHLLRHDVVVQERQGTRTKDGRTVDVTKFHPKGFAKANFQVVKADGRVVVFRDYIGEYYGTTYEAGQRPPQSHHELVERALHDMVHDFLADITPRRVIEKIVLDDKEPAVEPGVKLAQDGNLAAAERAWQAVLERNPRSAGATYNLGVLLETRGDFEGAEASYLKAIELSPKPLYRDALYDLRRRLREASSLQTPL